VSPYHKVWFSQEQERQRKELGIGNLGAWVRERMEEAFSSRTSLTVKLAEIHKLEDQLARQRTEVERIAVEKEQALAQAERAAEAARKVVQDSLRADPRASVQTTLANWLAHHPQGNRFRELVGPGLDGDALVNLLARWPDSRPELVKLIEDQERVA